MIISIYIDFICFYFPFVSIHWLMGDDMLARLLSFNNVIVTSHQGFFTREALDNIAHTTLQNVRDFSDGRRLTNEVRPGA